MIKFIVLFILSVKVFAGEVDQFTNRDQVPKDSLQMLDAEILKRLQEALDKSNKGILGTSLDQANCSGSKNEQDIARTKLFEAINEKLLTASPYGLIETFAEKKSPKRQILVDQSIYQSSLENLSVIKKFGLSSVINIGGIQIGTDKLGHFFDEGHTIYMSNHKRTSASDKEAVSTSNSFGREKSYDGLKSTGIVSYADMSANKAGFNFWEKLCGFSATQSTEEKKKYFQTYKCSDDAYFKCVTDSKTQKGHWEFNPKQKFSFKDYVTEAWDESINCSLYESETVAQQIFSEMSRRVYTYKGNPKQPCPAEPDKCVLFAKNLNKYPTQLISPVCREILSDKKSDEAAKFDYTYHESIPSSNSRKKLKEKSTSKDRTKK